jgi:radical SAM superfamily enzyme YgiQ (UPF0313 family)
MNICITETAPEVKSGSLGAALVKEIAARYGNVEKRKNGVSYDVELVSVHHQDDYDALVSLPKVGKVRVIGGHVTYTNPYPIIPFGDIICVGDAEGVLEGIMECLKHGNVNSLHGKRGIIISERHANGDAYEVNYSKYLHTFHSPHLSCEGGTKHWCIETTRGCVYNCKFCEIGVAKFRFKKYEDIQREVCKIDTKASKRIRLVSPEECSHPDYLKIRELLISNGLQHYSGGYRLENFLNNDSFSLIPKGNESIRVGIDGMSERLRLSVNKNITDKMIIDFFIKMTSLGHSKFKFYQIFGYDGETAGDAESWFKLLERIKRVPLRKNVIIEITWTPFIPQPNTKLAGCSGRYRDETAAEIKRWHFVNEKPSRCPGVFFVLTRFVSKSKHEQVLKRVLGDESTLL